MVYITIEPQQAEAFQKHMDEQGWTRVFQDGGQSQFIGWAYMMRWEKRLEAGIQGEVTLHYSDNHGQLEAYLEMNPAAKPYMEQWVKTIS